MSVNVCSSVYLLMFVFVAVKLSCFFVNCYVNQTWQSQYNQPGWEKESFFSVFVWFILPTV